MSATQRVRSPQQRNFTVEQEPRVDIIESKKVKKGTSSILLSILKCVITVLIAVSLLALTVISKLSLVSIGQRMGVNSTSSTVTINKCQPDKPATCEREVAFIMMMLVMIFPQFISLCRALRNSAFCNNQPWPTWSGVLWGIVGSLAEVFGICLFGFAIISIGQDAAKSIIYMNGIFLVPIFYQLFKQCRKRYAPKNEATANGYIKYGSATNGPTGYQSFPQEPSATSTPVLVISFLAPLLLLGGVAITMIKETANSTRISLIMFFILVSYAWCPAFKKREILARESKDNSAAGDEDEETVPVTDELDGEIVDWQKIHVKDARHRSSAINSTIKIFLIPLVSILYCYIFKIADLSMLSYGFQEFTNNSQLLTMFFFQIFSGLIGYLLALLACTMSLQKICFALPLLLSTPLSVIIVLTSSCHSLYLGPCTVHSNNELLITIGIGLLLWLSQVLSITLYIWKSQEFLMAREKMLFWVPSYDGVLLEQNLLLNRKNEVTDEYYINYHNIVKGSHIYICTTMYHESDFEMEQLLHSLGDIADARKRAPQHQKRQFESHIFFDDGARDTTVKRYALQLLSLLEKTVGAKVSQAMKLVTPYGIQLKWRLGGEMPLVIHLKDKFKVFTHVKNSPGVHEHFLNSSWKLNPFNVYELFMNCSRTPDLFFAVVKSKKRWSQVMYMSYILDFKQNQSKLDSTYILTTDADVKFTPNDVTALMDFMCRNPRVGAVCGRTHPIGSGPMVWYQIFDYAVGHWLLKVAEDIFGTVLCSPGCFSVYRARAIKDILPLYASGVTCAMDFLTKDMGEDRWLCTLMVEAGWRLEFCAAAQNYTYCPDTFDEFFKQRRRWTPSTLANQVLVISESKKIRENNDIIGFFFIVYQVILMVSSIIGPSTVILIIAGGLQYAYPYTVNMVAVLIVEMVVVFLFAIICLKTPQDFQLKTAKLLTFAFSLVMAVTIVGLILQTAEDIHHYIAYKDYYAGGLLPTTPSHPNTTIPPSTTPPTQVETLFLPTSWYLFIMIGIFLITGLLHGFEFLYLIHGFLYLLCLPSGYLFLTIFSVANLTDSSWGTREIKGAPKEDEDFISAMASCFKRFFWCCIPPELRNPTKAEQKFDESIVVQQSDSSSPVDFSSDDDASHSSETDSDKAHSMSPSFGGKDKTDFGKRSSSPPMKRSTSSDAPLKSALKKPGTKRQKSQDELDGADSKTGFRFPGQKVKFSANLPKLHSATTIEEWLGHSYQMYVPHFKVQGYDNVSFIAGMREKELLDIGIENRGHRKKLLSEIESLPAEELEQKVPENVEEWLIELGLDEYWDKFRENSYAEPKDLADLKFMDPKSFKQLFNINKVGHLRKLTQAVQKLQYPTAAQRLIREARKDIEKALLLDMSKDNGDDGDEYSFWVDLRELCLLPEQAAFSQSKELKEKLGELRDSALLILAISNILWLTFMIAVMSQGKKLEVLNTAFTSVAFLFIYAIVLIMQFFAMLWHRMQTWVHYIARVPFLPGKYHRNWSFRDEDLPPEPSQEELEAIRRRRRKRSRDISLTRGPSRSITSLNEDASRPLLAV